MIKYLSLFSGIGAFEKALQRLEIPYELVGYCEIDKYASKAYSLLHSVPEPLFPRLPAQMRLQSKLMQHIPM